MTSRTRQTGRIADDKRRAERERARRLASFEEWLDRDIDRAESLHDIYERCAQ